jgi:hypothetical protein
MTRASRLDLIRISALGAVLMLSATSAAPRRSPVVERLAKSYGLDAFEQVEAIRYTWNGQFPGATISHRWEWHPKTGEISFEGKDKDGKPVKVTYQRSQLASQDDAVKNQVDPAFINDNYWLLFPFHAYWDTGAEVQDLGRQHLPMGKGPARRLAVKYPQQGGYTPGDTWELYLGADERVEEMTYHRGGPKKPGVVIVTWEGYKKAGPLLVATEHRGTADGAPIRIWLSDVSVKLAGSSRWMTAQ